MLTIILLPSNLFKQTKHLSSGVFYVFGFVFFMLCHIFSMSTPAQRVGLCIICVWFFHHQVVLPVTLLNPCLHSLRSPRCCLITPTSSSSAPPPDLAVIPHFWLSHLRSTQQLGTDTQTATGLVRVCVCAQICRLHVPTLRASGQNLSPGIANPWLWKSCCDRVFVSGWWYRMLQTDTSKSQRN